MRAGRHHIVLIASLTAAVSAQPTLVQAAAAAGGGSDSSKPATADTVLVDKEPKDASVFKFDYGVPATPALTLLGVDSSKVTQSNSLKPFAFSLPSLVSGQQSGQAASVDFSPAAYLVPADQQTYLTYSAGNALWFRTHLGIGLYNGVGDADTSKQKASKASFGFSTSLLNSSDPLLARFPGQDSAVKPSAWVQCFDSSAAAIRAALPMPPEGTTEGDAMRLKLKAIEKQMKDLRQDLTQPLSQASQDALNGQLAQLSQQHQDLVTKIEASPATPAGPPQAPATGKVDVASYVTTCAKVANLAASLGGNFALGAGSVWSGTPGKLEKFEHPSAVAWMSYRHGLGVNGPTGTSYQAYSDWLKSTDQWFMAGISARYGHDETISTGDKATPQILADTWSIWLGLERYTPDDRLALQWGEQRTEPRLSTAKSFGGTRSRYLVTYDRKLTDGGLWVTASYGEANGTGALKDDKTAKVTFTLTSPDALKITGAPDTSK